jgi:hypothetical protein
VARRRNSANDPVPRRPLLQIIDPGYSVNCSRPYGERPVPDGQVRRRVRAGHDVDCTSVPAWHYLGPTGKLGGSRWQGSARAPETPGAGYFGLLIPEQTTAWHAYLDKLSNKNNWGSANGCHLSTGSRLPVPPIEPQLQRSICERRVPTPGHRVGGDGTRTRGPRQVRRGGRYMATLPAVARLRRGPLERDDLSSTHNPALALEHDLFDPRRGSRKPAK